MGVVVTTPPVKIQPSRIVRRGEGAQFDHSTSSRRSSQFSRLISLNFAVRCLIVTPAEGVSMKQRSRRRCGGATRGPVDSQRTKVRVGWRWGGVLSTLWWSIAALQPAAGRWGNHSPRLHRCFCHAWYKFCATWQLDPMIKHDSRICYQHVLAASL